MSLRPRFYGALIKDHLERHRQMALLGGPRQVGKTTTCRDGADAYLSWDNLDHRRIILSGPAAVTQFAGVDELRAKAPVLVLDELHKHAKWKALLKGLFDTYEATLRIVVTGSSRLDIYRRGGDSLMGRYLLYRMHPLSVAELIRCDIPVSETRPPAPVDETEWKALWEHGGFPEPFVRRDPRFSGRWRSLRQAQLASEDLRDVAHVQELGTMEALIAILSERSGQQLVYATVARELSVSIETVKRWVDLLSRLHYGFTIRPWFRNVAKALRKEPKWFLRDWSGIADAGSRAETLVACHLLKAVEGWTDLGFGDFELRYLRDKAKREVDFLVVRDRKPWILIEVKRGDTALTPALAHFKAQTKAEHAFQVVVDLPYSDVNCFVATRPCVVPARTLLSQLL